ncbi:hypothetical protein ABPG72_009057 [Tetrahymena utriculariae]
MDQDEQIQYLKMFEEVVAKIDNFIEKEQILSGNEESSQETEKEISEDYDRSIEKIKREGSGEIESEDSENLDSPKDEIMQEGSLEIESEDNEDHNQNYQKNNASYIKEQKL